MTMLLLQKVAE